jgi:hypothetical protein
LSTQRVPRMQRHESTHRDCLDRVGSDRKTPYRIRWPLHDHYVALLGESADVLDEHEKVYRLTDLVAIAGFDVEFCGDFCRLPGLPLRGWSFRQ